MRFPNISALRRALRNRPLLHHLQRLRQRRPLSSDDLLMTSLAVTLAWGLVVTFAAYTLTALAMP